VAPTELRSPVVESIENAVTSWEFLVTAYRCDRFGETARGPIPVPVVVAWPCRVKDPSSGFIDQVAT